MVILLAILGACLLVLLVSLLAESSVRRAALDKHSANPADLPYREFALVLGCSETLANGRGNLFFRYRIEAAIALWKAGKCRSFLVSGDNGRHGYDEPTAMRNALVDAGIPDARIHSDYAGFSTLDSIVRAREVFGLREVVIVSQRFHNERALFLAQHKGLDAVACDARDVSAHRALRTRIRERFARIKNFADVYLLGTKPKFPGPPEPIAFHLIE
jgi:SanA protein